MSKSGSRGTTRSGKTRLACRARAKNGKPCRAAARASGLCWRHDPSLLKKRKAAERNGGRRRAYQNGSSATVVTIEDVRQGLCEVVGRLQVQDNTVPVARALISAYGELRSTLEVGDLERRLAALEEQMGKRSGTSG
jgi:hypothetical protein